jgi:hypothetical protein
MPLREDELTTEARRMNDRRNVVVGGFIIVVGGFIL